MGHHAVGRCHGRCVLTIYGSSQGARSWRRGMHERAPQACSSSSHVTEQVALGVPCELRTHGAAGRLIPPRAVARAHRVRCEAVLCWRCHDVHGTERNDSQSDRPSDARARANPELGARATSSVRHAIASCTYRGFSARLFGAIGLGYGARLDAPAPE